jgi:hypothetical protein
MVQLSGTVGIPLSGVVDQHRCDANPDPNFHVDADPDPDPDWHRMMPILMQILLQVSHMLGKSQLCQSSCFIFCIGVKNVIILSILDSILKFCGKKYTVVYQLFHIAGIDMIRIQQNDADPTRSGSTTLQLSLGIVKYLPTVHTVLCVPVRCLPPGYQPYHAVPTVHSYLESYSYEGLKLKPQFHLTIWSIEDRVQLEAPQP